MEKKCYCICASDTWFEFLLTMAGFIAVLTSNVTAVYGIPDCSDSHNTIYDSIAYMADEV